MKNFAEVSFNRQAKYFLCNRRESAVSATRRNRTCEHVDGNFRRCRRDDFGDTQRDQVSRRSEVKKFLTGEKNV